MRYALLLAMLMIYAATAMGQVVPRDFLLHAHFAPGGVDVGVRDYSVPHARAEYPDPWDLIVRADGGGKREVYMTVVRGNTLDSNHVPSIVNLSGSSVADLVRVIRRENFFVLPDLYPKEAFMFHARVLVLSIQMDGHKHVVTLNCKDIPDRVAAERLRRIWKELLRQVPSPNENVELKCF